MEHLPLLFYFIAIILGLNFTGVLWVLKNRYGHPLLNFHFFQHVATSLYIIFEFLSLYGIINTGIFPTYLNGLEVFTTGSLVFVGFVIYFQTRSVYYLMNIKWTEKLNVFFLILSSIAPAVSFYMVFNGLSRILTMLAMGSWMIIQFYLIIRLAYNYRKIIDPMMKFISRTFFLMVLITFPIGWIDYNVQKIQLERHQYPVGIMSGPLIYAIEIFFIIFILFEAKKSLKINNSLPPEFILKFNPTDRERQIIEMICKGLTNKEIASKLFLSPATVRNHISNIFQKTSTPNRGKLISIIQSQN